MALLASLRGLKYHFAGVKTGLSKSTRRGKSMSFSDTEALKRQLLADDARYAELAHTHGEYERRLSELAELHYPSAEEQMEEATLKKKKLYLKDQMETIMRHYKEQHQVAGH